MNQKKLPHHNNSHKNLKTKIHFLIIIKIYNINFFLTKIYDIKIFFQLFYLIFK